MQQEERDRALLAIFEPEDRHKIEEVVNDIIADDLPTVDEAHLEAAVVAFDLRANGLPDEAKVVAWQIAAALRLRASGTLGVHWADRLPVVSEHAFRCSSWFRHHQHGRGRRDCYALQADAGGGAG